MSRVKGKNFRMFIDGTAVPEETNVSITLNGNSESTTDKDTEGLFTKDDIVSTSWNAQVDSYQAEPDQIRNILTMFKAAQPLPVSWDETTGTPGSKNRIAKISALRRSGMALLNDFNFEFNDRESVNTSLQFMGTGALN